MIGIFGPTAAGKTAVAEAIAARIPAEIVSADSAAAYAGIPILTAAPARPTRLVGVWELAEEASVAEYQRLAHAAIDETLARGATPIVVGGTGLYLRAALADLQLQPPPAPGARRRWQTVYDDRGPAAAHALLAERDPAAAARVHANDRRRVVRALELAEAGASLAPDEDALWTTRTRHPTLLVGLDLPAETLRERIEQRTRAMFTRGVVDEVRRATAGPLSETARKVLGLREVAELPPDAASDEIVRATLRLSRYQRKWMRRLPGLVTVSADRPPEETADEILALARARERLPADGGG